MEEFKEKLDKYLQHIPDETNIEGLIPSADLLTAAPIQVNSGPVKDSKLRRPGTLPSFCENEFLYLKWTLRADFSLCDKH